MKRIALLILATLSCLAVAQSPEGIIQQHCDNQWPGDASMYAFCAAQQRSAIDELNALTRVHGGIPADAYSIAYNRCEHEWLNDFSMQAFCVGQQIEGYNSFHTVTALESSIATETEREQIRRHCTLQWVTDFSMLAFCKDTQLKSLNFLKSRPEWINVQDWNLAVSSCSVEWREDYSMIEFCVKQRFDL